MSRERLVSPDIISKEEESFNQTLRPPTLAEYIGQKKVVEKLEIALEAARRRSEPLEHALFHGPTGLGKTINVPLKKFTLIGATTRAGSLSAPLRNRFGLFYHLDFYDADELREIVVRSARILDVRIDDAGSSEIARRARGTPRIANRL